MEDSLGLVIEIEQESDPVNTTVMIVDDEPVNLTLLSEILKSRYHLRAINSGERALQAAQVAPQPDLILLDVMMPGMNGYTVLTELRENPLTRDIPVIFVTALGDETDEERGLTLGAVDYITKPISPAIVLARVQAHLDLKRARDRLRDQNTWLEAEVARRMRENLLVQDVTLCAMAELAETRDNETGNHILRTQAYVEVLAKALQRAALFPAELDDLSITCIAKAAPLHDIGKVGIPDRILLKPGRLTEEEFAVMKTHSRIGADAIQQAMERALTLHGGEFTPGSLAFLDTARIIARSHHERWDGKGYPDGLRAAQIPLPARLMAVADVFDALTSKRVYKPAMSVEEAARLIESERESHFDPQVVDAFVASRGELKAIAARFADTPEGRERGRGSTP